MDETHSVTCAGFIDGGNVGISIVCAVCAVIRRNFPGAASTVRTKKHRNMKLRNPRNAADQ